MTDISRFQPLNENRRLAAREKARTNLLRRIGKEPKLSDFEKGSYSKYGPGVDRFVNITMGLLLLAALLISAFHIANMGYYTFLEGVDNQWMAFLTAISLVILSESAVLLLSVMPAIWEMPNGMKRIMYVGTIGAALIAAIGNIDTSIVYDHTALGWVKAWLYSFLNDPGNFIIATMPPVLTLIVGQGIKYRVLAIQKNRFDAKRAYDEEKANWDRTVENVETHPEWSNRYAFALWDEWRSRRKPETLENITSEERQAIVLREMRMDNFFSDELSAQISTRPEVREKVQNPGQKKAVIDHLGRNPADAELLPQQLVEKLAEAGVEVSPSTAYRAIKDFSEMSRNGQHG
jgi:hypothetical protein